MSYIHVFFVLSITSTILYLVVGIFRNPDDRKRNVVLLTIVLAVVLFFGLKNGLKIDQRKKAFGPDDDLMLIGLMYTFIVLGTLANYFFFKDKGALNVRTVLKPILISPILLLPLIGILPSQAGSVNTQQYVSLSLIAFQNGFFWKEILEKAKQAL